MSADPLSLMPWMAHCVRSAIAPHARTDTPAGRLMVFLYQYIQRRLGRLAALFAAWKAGTLRRSRPRVTPSPGAPASEAPSPEPPSSVRVAAWPVAAPSARIRLPRIHGWLIRQIQPTAIGHHQLAILFSDPEILRFLAEVPGARRILRPLCTALALTPPEVLRLPPRPRPPRPRAASAAPSKARPRARPFDPKRYSPGRRALRPPKPA